MSRVQELLEAYEQDHQHPLNRGLHLVGITLIGTSVILVFVAPLFGVMLFGLGWTAQFVGHAIEGKRPSFTRDPRFMGIGALWYLKQWRALAARVRERVAGVFREDDDPDAYATHALEDADDDGDAFAETYA